MGYVREFRPGDEVSLASNLRAADLQEMRALSHKPPVELLLEGGMTSAPSCTIVGNHHLVAGMFGVVDEGNGVGRIWLMGTDELVTNPLRRQFIKECRIWLRGLEQRYKVLLNNIDARNTVHIRWLKWMGFTILNPRPFGVEGQPFYEFIKVRRSPCVIR